jgi:hypothetical protein
MTELIVIEFDQLLNKLLTALSPCYSEGVLKAKLRLAFRNINVFRALASGLNWTRTAFSNSMQQSNQHPGQHLQQSYSC